MAERGNRIAELFRDEVDKNPAIKTLGSVAQILIFNPFHTATVLIQVGYEPLPPVLHRPNLFRFGGGYYYPNIFRYMKYLAEKENSKLVLWRGITPRLCSVLVTNTVRKEVLAALPPSLSKCPPEQIAFEVGRQCTAAGFAVLISHPLLVVTNRMIVSLIGNEDKYASTLSAIQVIFQEEGLLGFYAGIVPHLLGELLGKAIEVLSQEIVEKTELDRRLGLPRHGGSKSTVIPISALHGLLTYPLQLATTIMTVNNCGLAVSDLPGMQGTGDSWISCLKVLWNTSNMKRGSNLMFARLANKNTWHTPPVEDQGCADGMCSTRKSK